MAPEPGFGKIFSLFPIFVLTCLLGRGSLITTAWILRQRETFIDIVFGRAGLLLTAGYLRRLAERFLRTNRSFAVENALVREV